MMKTLDKAPDMDLLPEFVIAPSRCVANESRLFRARNKRHNSEDRIIPSGRLEAAGFVGFRVGCAT
jgi:hypothetical protein